MLILLKYDQFWMEMQIFKKFHHLVLEQLVIDDTHPPPGYSPLITLKLDEFLGPIIAFDQWNGQ